MRNDAVPQDADEGQGDWDDLLGTGTVMKQVLVRGRRWQADNDDDDDDEDDGINMEAPRKFFALIDIETRLHNSVTKEPRPVESECHRNFLINSDADLFAGAHLVIPLMDIHETSRYIFDSKFAYGSLGNLPHVPTNCKLDCIIRLKVRSSYDEFLEQLRPSERLLVAARKRARGKFWFAREDYQMAISMYQSLAELCLSGAEGAPPVSVGGGQDLTDAPHQAVGCVANGAVNHSDDGEQEGADEDDEYELAPEA